MLASEVSVNRRLLQCASAIIWCLFSGGPIFGFAALKPVLIREHIYENVCDISVNLTSLMWGKFALDPSQLGSVTVTLLSSVVRTADEEAVVAKCTEQDLKLNMMFTVGAMLTNVSALVIGRTLDNYGPKVCGLVGAFFLYVACAIFIFSSWIESSFLSFVDPYLVGYALMALGGPFAYMSSFQLSNSFPAKSGSILAIVTGAFDASSALFLIYRIIYNKSGYTFTLDKFFKIYLLVPVFITIVELTIMPSESYKTSPDTALCADDAAEVGAVSETDALLAGEVRRPSQPSARRDSIGDALKQPYAIEGEEFLVEHSGGVFGILHGYSARYQLNTPWFYLMCLFATIQMLRLNYFVATVGTQYTFLLDSLAKGTLLNRFFDVALPLGGIISIPFVGIFLDYCSTVVVLTGLLGVSLLIGVLGLIPSFVLGFVNVAVFVAYRPFFYTAVSDFCAKVFGFDTFGTVYGTIICISGAVNYFQSYLDKLTHTTFNMNPTPINLALVVITAIIGTITILYVRTEAKKYSLKKAHTVRV